MSLDFPDFPDFSDLTETPGDKSILSKYPNWKIIETYSQGDCFFSSFYRFSIKYNKNNLVIPGVTLQDLDKLSELDYILKFRLYFINYILTSKTLFQHFNDWSKVILKSDIEQLIAIRDKIPHASYNILHTYDVKDLDILISIRDNNFSNFKESIRNKISVPGSYSGFVEITFFQDLWREKQQNPNISPLYNDTIYLDINQPRTLDLLNLIEIYINKKNIIPLLFLRNSAHYEGLEYIKPFAPIKAPSISSAPIPSAPPAPIPSAPPAPIPSAPPAPIPSAPPVSIPSAPPAPIKHKIIGYSFDGVIHKSVNKENEIGVREGTIDNLDEYKKNKFTQIIDRIKEYNKLGYTQYIITSRNREQITIIYDLLEELNIINMLSIISVELLHEWEILNAQKVEEYYDASSLIIKSLLMHQKKLELPYLKKIYLTIPEEQGFNLINNENDIIDTHFLSTINTKHLFNIINTNRLININKRKYKKYKNKYLSLKNNKK
jgi:hypothetical protein